MAAVLIHIEGVLIRHAEPVRDAAACAAIYEPYVRDTVISLEERPPSADEIRMPELPLNYHQRHAFARHLNRVRTA